MLNVCKRCFLTLSVFSMVFTRLISAETYEQGTYTKKTAERSFGDAGARFFSRSRFVRDSYPQSSGNDLAESELFLTSYIESGQIEKGQKLATVPPMLEDVQSFAGYLTVNKTTGSNLFFWLFKSQEGNWEERSLVMWLQGGPGISSLFGLFNEVGPFSVTKEKKLVKREYSWNRKYNLVFFDQPVGVGFSYTKSNLSYARDEHDVARDLYEAIVQLYKLFPSLQNNKLIITGQSYAGKYIPAIAHKIYKMNRNSSFRINVAGLMIGNGWTDPIHQVGYASYLYDLGLVDSNRRDELVSMEEEIREDIRKGKFAEALRKSDEEFLKIGNLTGLRSYYDYINDGYTIGGSELQFINETETKAALHVGRNDFCMMNELVVSWLENDQMQSDKLWVEELLTAEEFPIMYYSGQLDIVVAYPLGVEFYNSLKWPRAEEYRNANRCQFKVGDKVAGYYKMAGTFIEVLVRNTGHAVPAGQPKWAFELLDRFVTNSSSFKCE